jgi:hypothetical protein
VASGSRLIFIGANPGVLLHDEHGPRCFASIWRAEWSLAGAGDVIIVVDRWSWRGFGRNRELGEWLAATLTQWFPEVDDLAPLEGLAWLDCDLTIAWDAGQGGSASADGVTVGLSEPMTMVPIGMAFRLGSEVASLRNVYIPCRHGSIEIDGAAVEGVPRVEGEVSTAFLAMAEVWSVEQ